MSFAKHLAVLACLLIGPAGADDLQSLFDGAINDISGKNPVPIYLPTVIPEAIAKYGVKQAIGTATNDGYAVSLYYSLETSNATFAGMISGSTRAFSSLPDTVVVQLSNGISALFRPVRCGGSCAPANLWWQVDGVQYSVQLKLPSDLSEAAQRELVVEAANSMSLRH